MEGSEAEAERDARYKAIGRQKRPEPLRHALKQRLDGPYCAQCGLPGNEALAYTRFERPCLPMEPRHAAE